MPITAATKLLGVIGNPVSHSLSPHIHNTFITDCGLDLVYLAFPVAEGDLAGFVQSVKVLGVRGFNITMPHKQAILPYLDDITEQAQRSGAVNSVKIQEGRLYGHNTDGEGFLRALGCIGFEPRGKTALILGRGGAAQTIALALAEQGVLVSMAARSRDLPCAGRRVRSVLWHEIHREAESCDLLINATPLGMESHRDKQWDRPSHGDSLGKEFSSLSFLDSLSKQALVVDLIYAPLQTQLLQRAEKLGLPFMNGLPLLIHQAALAFEFFTDVSPSLRCINGLLDSSKNNPLKFG